MNKYKQFEEALEKAEELVKNGIVANVEVTIYDDELIKNTYIGEYYKKGNTNISGDYLSAFYERVYKFEYTKKKITVHLCRPLTEKEKRAIVRFDKEKAELCEKYNINPLLK